MTSLEKKLPAAFPIDILVAEKYRAIYVEKSPSSLVEALVTIIPVDPPLWVVRARFDFRDEVFLDDPKHFGLRRWKCPELAAEIVEPSDISDIDSMTYHSQVGQDRFVDEFFDGMTGGVFVDVGAYDGVTFSNTAFLERVRGWTGLCVEPMQARFDELKWRRRCRCVRAAIASQEGDVEFTEILSNVVNTEMLSGVTGRYGSQHGPRVQHEIRAHGAMERRVRVPGCRLDVLLDEAEIRKVDYVSIDVEGSEIEVLQSFDPRAYDVKILTVENNYRSDKIIERAMQSFGYILLATLAHDDVYIPRRT